MKRNILLVLLALVVGLVTAPHFGSWYDKFYPQYGDWIYDKSFAVNFAGFLLSYVFFAPLFLEILGLGNKKKWIFWCLLPVMLFFLYGGLKLLCTPLVFVIIAICVAKLINFIIKKFRHPNPPMIVK